MKSGEIQLYELLRKRIMTTMIGAIASLEKFSDLMTEEEFQSLRTEIMDKGNDQIRKLKEDLSGFSISIKKTIFVPLRRNKGNGQ